MFESSSHISGQRPDMGPNRCRVAKHTLNEGSYHYDLFIDLDGVSNLVTLEIDFDKIGGPSIDDRSSTQAGHHFIDFYTEDSYHLLSESFAGEATAVKAYRKSDHRRIYLEYTGEISEGRGMLHHIATGTFWGSLTNEYEEFILYAIIGNGPL